ncbi:MAG: 4Fe-4S dicluster domain-containing protein, partial [Bacteroidia bacterium]|nr:4Fe-4S dicluster domain-containing protein [Bacteroidia bacterium]
KDENLELDSAKSWRNVALVAFGQGKMFKRWIPGIFHLFIYVAFILTQIELIEILIDGVFGTHRFFVDKIGALYPFIIGFIELLSVLAFVATLIFLIRRNLLKVPRFHKDEMTGWPKLDGNIILYLEILLLIGIFSMNGSDYLLQSIDAQHYPTTGGMMISSFAGPAIFGGLETSTLVGIERAGWWLHILVVFGFMNYLPYSKHLHIFLAFPNTYYASQSSRGKMENMPEIMNEVKSMMGLAPEMPVDESAELPEFGAKDIFDLSWKNIMDAYTCTECGRCTSVCPANLTGKKLSPRKILMDIRDRTAEVGFNLDSGNKEFIDPAKKAEDVKLSSENYQDGKTLFDRIDVEEIRACTTCNACVEACPVLIDPLDPILKLRRHEILTQSTGPADWLPMFNSMENTGSVWAISDDRDKWAQDLKA